jgi:Uma2 family endonuclease
MDDLNTVDYISVKHHKTENGPKVPEFAHSYEEYAGIKERVEVFHNRVYMMASPTNRHQIAALEIHRQLANQLIGKPCVPFAAPADVELYDEDNAEYFTTVQPDVFIVCDKKKIGGLDSHIKGAPDFILEVLSPSNMSTDMLLKSYYYAKAGVKEYWLLDAKQRNLTICVLDEKDFYSEKRDLEAAGKIKLLTKDLWVDFDDVFARLEAVG